MRQALSDDLAAPTEPNAFLTALYERPVGYVFYAREDVSHDGSHKWQAVGDGNLLERGRDGVLRFGFGIALQRSRSSNLPTMIYLRFSVEDLNESEIKLSLERRDGIITIHPSSGGGYAEAAKITNDWLMQVLANPISSQNQLAIGFGR